MSKALAYSVNPGWRLILIDLGIQPANVLRRAGLPDDLFAREGAALGTEEYFRLWKGLEEEADDPALPIRIAEVISTEAFDPLLFAALCSPGLKVALKRIAQYKRLIGPMAHHHEETRQSFRMEVEYLNTAASPPVILMACELAFVVQLARMGTRERIRPLRVALPALPGQAEKYTEYFGVEMKKGPRPCLVFSHADAARPFMTANDSMWSFFEPKLKKRLSELDESASMADRVRGALLEMLPSGESSIEEVSKRLRYSARTLQRRLSAEGESFTALLNKTREDLAHHYLKSSALSGAQISFLLGFADPNSFFRAFHSWTGRTPESVRSGFRAGMAGNA